MFEGSRSMSFSSSGMGEAGARVAPLSRAELRDLVTRGGPVELGAGHDGAALQGNLRDLLVASVA